MRSFGIKQKKSIKNGVITGEKNKYTKMMIMEAEQVRGIYKVTP